ncbi:MAG: thiamine-monophosphate kinase, partial [Candidatus Tectimicrobiota bacterium]
SSDLAHICAASRVGAQLEAVHIPLAADVSRVAQALQADPLMLALHGGEDFELCLTAPPGALAPVQALFTSQFHCPLVRIGTIQPGDTLSLRFPDGTSTPLRAQGYDHFRRTP